MAKKKLDDEKDDDDKLEADAEEKPKKERADAEDLELDLGDDDPKEEPAAAADAEDADEEPATRKARRDKRRSDVVAEEKERSARLEAEVAELRRQVQAGQQYRQPQQEPQRQPQQAEGPDELDTLRWHAQMAARAAQDDRLPEADRTRAAAEFNRIKATHDRIYLQRNAPAQVDEGQIRDRMTREFLVAEDPEAFTDPAIAEACRAEVDRLTADPRVAALPALAIGRMAIKSARAKLGRPVGGSAAPDAAAQAKLGASSGRGQAAPAKRTVKIPRHIVGLARDTFPKAKTDEEAVRLWAARARKANPDLIKELGL